MIREYLKNNILITDGEMGTYYAQLTGNTVVFSEYANITDADLIKRIHRQYVNAGAKLIRTNTFSANSITLGVSREELKEIIRKGYDIAKSAISQDDVYIAADIGPIPVVKDKVQIDKRTIIDEYLFIIDTFLEAGADIFVFETFSSVDYLKEVTEYIKRKKPEAFIITQFVIMPDGYTRQGISAAKIVQKAKNIKYIDAYGFNCGSGPTHLYNNMKQIHFGNDIVAALPNAGFPEIINERTVYSQNEDYFADTVVSISKLGVKIVGGCCGTTPAHIRKIAEKLMNKKIVSPSKAAFEEVTKIYQQPIYNSFYENLKKKKFTIAVELDPPSTSDLGKVLTGAELLKANGVHVITVADSPLAKARANSLMVASIIQRKVGIDVIPHICCRDRNSIALKSDLLAAHIEGIRNILIVTGDPIPGAGKSEIKSVFNFNSLKLMEFVSVMNKELFKEDPYYIGGALNLNANNKDAEILRMHKKIEAGARFFLTQPIYDDDTIEYLSKIHKPDDIKILAGIMPLVSYKNAQFLNNEVPEIKIPDKYIGMFREDMTREEGELTGIQIVVEIAEKVKKYVDGFYFIAPFNRADMIVKIIKQLDNN